MFSYNPVSRGIIPLGASGSLDIVRDYMGRMIVIMDPPFRPGFCHVLSSRMTVLSSCFLKISSGNNIRQVPCWWLFQIMKHSSQNILSPLRDDWA